MDSASTNEGDPTAPNKNKHILLVYSNEATVQQIQSILTNNGYSRISVAPTAQMAISEMRHTDFDCIVMDIDLSDLDGWRLSRLIRANVLGNKPDIPIIIGSYTYSYRIAEATAKEFEVNGFVDLNNIKTLPSTVDEVLYAQQGL